jgi:hypothetical protein
MIANSSLDINLVYHSSWGSGSFWKSTNMGTSFTDLFQGGNLWACDVAKDDPMSVTYDRYSNTCYISLDGGSTFTSAINVGSSPQPVLFGWTNQLYYISMVQEFIS